MVSPGVILCVPSSAEAISQGEARVPCPAGAPFGATYHCVAIAGPTMNTAPIKSSIICVISRARFIGFNSSLRYSDKTNDRSVGADRPTRVGAGKAHRIIIPLVERQPGLTVIERIVRATCSGGNPDRGRRAGDEGRNRTVSARTFCCQSPGRAAIAGIGRILLAGFCLLIVAADYDAVALIFERHGKDPPGGRAAEDGRSRGIYPVD